MLLMVEEEELKNMEAQEGAAVITTPSKDLSQIVKGKRTKRQRPQSPIPFTIATTHSSSNGGDNFVNSTTTTEEEEIVAAAAAATTTTEEEEDTAKCLLLLSQGHQGAHNNSHKDDNDFGTTFKFSSKKYLETQTTNGKAGIYVYECKTCNRTFSSFQALGGHRASHRKPKAAVDFARKTLINFSDDDDEVDEQKKPPFKRSLSTSSLSLQLTPRTATTAFNNNDHKSSHKVHECAICGTEFSSGQALGGHMRRHRGAAPQNRSSATTTTANTTLCLSPFSSINSNQIDHESKKLKSSVNLSLDLNLPAAPEDHENHPQNHESSAFFFASQQHQQQKQSTASLVLPATPALVDCQY